MTTPTQQADELLPCPFCGGEARINHPSDYWTGGCFNDGCVAATVAAYTREEIVSAWNTRTPPHAEAVRVLVEAVRQAEKIFDRYTKLHREKNTPDGHAKADINKGYAQDMKDALNHPAVAAVIRNEAVTDCDAQKRNTVMKENG